MASTRSWTDVTPAILACVKASSAHEHGTRYDPPDADKGTATTDVTAIGTIVLGYELGAGDTLTYTIQKKPFLVSETEIWSGIDSAITACRVTTSSAQRDRPSDAPLSSDGPLASGP
jgi:hypothetical protein